MHKLIKAGRLSTVVFIIVFVVSIVYHCYWLAGVIFITGWVTYFFLGKKAATIYFEDGIYQFLVKNHPVSRNDIIAFLKERYGEETVDLHSLMEQLLENLEKKEIVIIQGNQVALKSEQ